MVAYAPALWAEPSLDEHRQEMDALLSDENMAVFIAERLGGGLGGFIEVGTRAYAEGCHSSPVGYIEGWYVDPDLRRQGLGRALIATAEAWARQRGLHEIASDALIDNIISHEAHLALGYEEVERVVCFRKNLEITKRED